MRKRLALALVLAAVLTFGLALPAAAAGNPTVTITMSAQIVLISNTEDTWTVGALTAGGVAVYFSADNSQDDDYSTITNTGNVGVDISIKGTNAIDTGTPSTYNWTLASAEGDKQFSLYANNTTGGPNYTTEVTTGGTAWISDLAKDATYDWSMKLTPPTIFDAADDGGTKTCTVTLVATKA